jgi:catechol 2,3-dioxygenase-like lactoylglutathione lyase family enzyme
MEDDPRPAWAAPRARPEVPSVLRLVRMSVQDLDRSRTFLRDVLGMVEAPPVHGPEHERLWGLDGAEVESAAFWGGDFIVEAVRYANPAPEPRPADYRLSDQGLLNFAAGSLGPEPFARAMDRVTAAGLTAYRELAAEGFRCQYVEDDQGFSVELLYMDGPTRDGFGFTPVG